MPASQWTDQHSRTIAAAAPDVPEPSATELDRIWRAVAPRPDACPSAPRRRVGVVVTAMVATGTLVVGGAAAAGVFTAHTGRYPSDAEDVRLGGPGERLDPAASDYGRVIDEETTDIPFPDTRSRAIARASLVADGQRDAPGSASVSTGAMRLWTAQAAICAWSNAWAASDEGSPARRRATDMIDASTTWPAVTDVDPVQRIRTIRQKVVDENGRTRVERLDDSTEAGYLPRLQEAAHGSDPAALGAVLRRWVVCQPDLMTALPQALPRG